MATLYKKQNPHLFDKAINAIEDELSDRVAWLSNIFGNAERLIKQIDGVRYYTPNWYNSDNDYTLLAPDSRLGNFAFFVLDEPIDLDFMQADRATCTTPFSLIVWGDMRTIAADRDKELAKQDILQALATMRIREGRFTINRIYEKAENVFEGFTFDEIENQFLMHPFAGWRFEGELTINTACIEEPEPVPTTQPVIMGHVIDGASTFTFRIDEQQVTVDVAADGKWYYYPTNDTFSADDMFNGCDNLDYVVMKYCTVTSTYQMFYNCIDLQYADIEDNDFSQSTDARNMFHSSLCLIGVKWPENFKPIRVMQMFYGINTIDYSPSLFANVTDLGTYGPFINTNQTMIDFTAATGVTLYRDSGYVFRNATRIIKLPAIGANVIFENNRLRCNNLYLLEVGKFELSELDIRNSSLLLKQSVLNLINAAAVDVTYTLHANVYSKCANGGEWYTDIQAAIDAKAAQGITVTLIS